MTHSPFQPESPRHIPSLDPGAKQHLTDDELICRLHGLNTGLNTGLNAGLNMGPDAPEAHLDACPDCRARWSRIEQRHAILTATPRLSEGFFAAQRRRIAERIQRASSPWAPLMSIRVPAFLALLLTAGLVYYRFNPAPHPPITTASTPVEAEWFENAYANIGAIEPRAASPIRELFATESAE